MRHFYLCIHFFLLMSANTSHHRKLAAIMFTDIVGYTALMQQDESQALALRAIHRQVFEAQHTIHHGEILQYYGDGTLSIFDSSIEAVHCALAIQQKLWQSSPQVPVRIGLHSGDIVYSQTEVYGDGVNIASRVENLAVAGSILLSGKLNLELHNQSGIRTQFLGKFRFKNVRQPMEIFAISHPDIEVPAVSQLKTQENKSSRSIAVLPFMNMSANPENEFFSDGMTEEIINALTRVKGLKVTSRTSSFYFKNKHLPITQIGQELNVAIIMEGSVRLSGKLMRITVQLIDVADDFHFWSETFDRSVEDVFAVQDEISLLIAERLREQLGHLEIEEHLVDDPRIPYEMYMQYLKSRYFMLQMSRQGMEKGLAILNEVVAKYPDYAMAHLGINMAYTLFGTMGYLPASEAFMKGKPHLDKAIELDPGLPECQLHLAWSAFLQDFNLKKTYHHLQQVIAVRPIVDYYQTMASVLVAEKKFQAALTYLETAYQLDPFSEIFYHLKGFVLYCQEKYEEAVPLFVRNMEIKPDSRVSVLYRGQALLLLGRADEAMTLFENLPEPKEDLLKTGGITLVNIKMGKMAEAEEGLATIARHLETEMMERAIFLLILCQTSLGNHDKALDWLEKGVDSRLPMMVYLPIEPWLQPLHGHERYHQIISRIFIKTSTEPITSRKYKRSLLEPHQVKKYRQQLLELMHEEKPYLDPDLTLPLLAQQMELPANQLSQLLNEGFDQNFAEFVNTYRLQAFRQKLAEGLHQQLTLLALAYDSGFNSKTVFNTFFKKAMGTTPKSYLKSMEG